MRERIINYYWKTRRYYWKYKFLIRKVIVRAVEQVSSVRLPYRKVRSKLYWKIYSATTALYWKTYSAVTALYWKTHGAITAGYWKLRRGYDHCRVFFIRLLWKLKGVFNYISGHFIGYMRHFAVVGYWKTYRFLRFAKDESPIVLKKLKKIKPKKSIKDFPIFFPIKKVYWFINYQVQKRIYPVFEKKTKTD